MPLMDAAHSWYFCHSAVPLVISCSSSITIFHIPGGLGCKYLKDDTFVCYYECHFDVMSHTAAFHIFVK